MALPAGKRPDDYTLVAIWLMPQALRAGAPWDTLALSGTRLPQSRRCLAHGVLSALKTGVALDTAPLEPTLSGTRHPHTSSRWRCPGRDALRLRAGVAWGNGALRADVAWGNGALRAGVARDTTPSGPAGPL